jgi:transcriptional regulator GlxA family with amidase domain
VFAHSHFLANGFPRRKRTTEIRPSGISNERRRLSDEERHWYREGVRIDIPVFDGVDELDAIGPYEVFRSAANLGAAIDARLVSRAPTDEIRCAYGLRLRPDGAFEPGDADALVVPGGGWAAGNEVGAGGEVQRGDWATLLAPARRTCSLIGGVCTGTLILAHAGLVKGRRAGTHCSAQQDLRDLGVEVVDERVVDDGDLVTSGGVTSGIDLALWIVEREFSRDLADSVARRMEYARFRPYGR